MTGLRRGVGLTLCGATVALICAVGLAMASGSRRDALPPTKSYVAAYTSNVRYRFLVTALVKRPLVSAISFTLGSPGLVNLTVNPNMIAAWLKIQNRTPERSVDALSSTSSMVIDVWYRVPARLLERRAKLVSDPLHQRSGVVVFTFTFNGSDSWTMSSGQWLLASPSEPGVRQSYEVPEADKASWRRIFAHDPTYVSIEGGGIGWLGNNLATDPAGCNFNSDGGNPVVGLFNGKTGRRMRGCSLLDSLVVRQSLNSIANP